MSSAVPGSEVTERELVAGLEALGVEPGAVVIAHCALSSFGVVVGGEQSVVAALRRAVGPLGTLTMPTQSWQLCDPGFLDPKLEPSARVRMREELPVFDSDLTPTRTMGAVAELFRLQPGSRRSPHPHRSFAAAGLEAVSLTATHDLDDPFGESSPLARLYDSDATVLLLGVGFDRCTALHLAERRARGSRMPRVLNGAPLVRDGGRAWVAWHEPTFDDGSLEAVGEAFERSGAVRISSIGKATCRAMRMRSLVDFAQTWWLGADY